VQPLSLARRHARLPCRLYHFEDGYYVLRARAACTELLGARITAVDGQAIEKVVEGMYQYFGGPRNHYEQFAAVFFLELPELLHAAGLASAAERLGLHVVMQDGTEHDVAMAAEPADSGAARVYSDEYLSPRPIEGEPAGWTTLLHADAKLPVFLRDYDDPFHAELWPDKATYYVQFRSNEDEPGHPIGPFVKRVGREIAADRPRAVVLDLRLDQGGDFTTTASLMKNLPDLADSIEHVYVLTSAWTFSAGNISLALVKEHGGAKVTVVGQHVGDRIRMWAEGGRLTLPNSKLAIGFTTGLHDYSRSCSGEDGCFWLMRFCPTHVTTFEPDVHVAYTFQDYVARRDPLLDRALELAHVR
jgi:hypothetical protein